MWKVYKYIEKSLPEQDKEFLVDEVLEIFKKIDKDEFLSILILMYGVDFQKHFIPAEYGLLFIKGIKKNNLFDFIEFITKRLKNDPA